MEFALIIFSAFMSCLSFAFCTLNFIEMRAMQKSTHSVQYVPIDEKSKMEDVVGEFKFNHEDEDLMI